MGKRLDVVSIAIPVATQKLTFTDQHPPHENH